MSPDWEKDLKWSARAFSDLVWPLLNEIMPGDLVHVEAITHSDFARDLDAYAGIDAWHIVGGTGIRGIASRVQVCQPPLRPYNTFTIRRSRESGTKTEYEKRKEAIESDKGWLYPHLTVQSYVTQRKDGQLLSFGVARTRDVITDIAHWIEHGEPQGDSHVYIRRTYNASFYVVTWTDQLMLHTYGGRPS